MNDIYERKLSKTPWTICCVVMVLGLVVWAWGCLICLNEDVMLPMLFAAISFVMMLTGVEGLIGQWSENSLEALTKKGIRRGFGLILIAGILAIIAAVLGIVTRQYENTPVWMLLGAIMVTASSAVCISGFKKIED